ncbi:DUF2937 family protein [bacterium]|nr:DUF2937 family protein [bacterium]
MILRGMVLAGGLAGAAATSQFPEFSQQYLQRLGGAVDALGEVVADFDASATASDLTREDALAQMQGTPFLERRSADMTRSIARFERLSSDLETLQGQGPFMRAYNGTRFTDAEIARAAWQAYQPAVPVIRRADLRRRWLCPWQFHLQHPLRPVAHAVSAAAEGLIRPLHLDPMRTNPHGAKNRVS